MNPVYLLVGSNIDKEVNIPAAVKKLKKIAKVVAISSIYETAPRGLHDQPNFFNLAILIETELTPSQIKTQIIEPIEQSLRRERQEDKNAPRTIDLDIVLFGNLVIDYVANDGRKRHIPDPDLLRYAHVAIPVAELAPTLPHPETGQNLADIARNLLAELGSEPGLSLWKREDIIFMETGNAVKKN